MKFGFGMSEFHSSSSLQTSALYPSFPKGDRFKSLDNFNSAGSKFTMLPSIFSNNKKGYIFGTGNRNNYDERQKPGPADYNVNTESPKKRKPNT